MRNWSSLKGQAVLKEDLPSVENCSRVGDTLAFHTDLHLMPDAQLGFYVSYNSLGKGEGRPREWVWQRFLDRYFPYTPPSGVSPADAQQDAKTLDGRYLVTRRAETTFLSMFNLVEQAKVSFRCPINRSRPGQIHTPGWSTSLGFTQMTLVD